VQSRRHFQETLDAIRDEVVHMGSRVVEMVRLAVDAAITDDTGLARRVVEMDDEVDAMERNALEQTVLVVLKEAPVAGDLRFLITTLGVIGELEKAADKAVKLARKVPKLAGRLPAEIKVRLKELGDMSRGALAATIRLYTEYSATTVEELIHADDLIDNAYRECRQLVQEMIQRDPDQIERYLVALEALHTLEHVGDQVVAIAERMQMLHSPSPSSDSSPDAS
jgi:phosphate transport system protein